MTMREATVGEVLAYDEQCVGIGVLDMLEKLRTFRALVLDADGVWWDGREQRSVTHVRQEMSDGGEFWREQDVVITKTRDLRDGQGLSFLRGLGLRVLFATAEGEPLTSCVAKLNRLPSVVAGLWLPVDVLTELRTGKAGAVASWLDVWGVSYQDVVFVGDDRTDLEVMRAVRETGGLVIVPADAQRCALKLAHVRLSKPGGGGAIRQLSEMVCDARGVDESTMATC